MPSGGRSAWGETRYNASIIFTRKCFYFYFGCLLHFHFLCIQISYFSCVWRKIFPKRYKKRNEIGSAVNSKFIACDVIGHIQQQVILWELVNIVKTYFKSILWNSRSDILVHFLHFRQMKKVLFGVNVVNVTLNVNPDLCFTELGVCLTHCSLLYHRVTTIKFRCVSCLRVCRYLFKF